MNLIGPPIRIEKIFKSIHKTQKLGFWIKHIYIMWYRWRHWGQYLTSNWPQIDLSIGKSIRQLKKYILLFYSSTLIELNIHLVRINHVLWRHYDVISTFFGQIWPEWPLLVNNDEEKSRNKIVEHENSTNRHYLANISMKQFIFGWFSRGK